MSGGLAPLPAEGEVLPLSRSLPLQPDPLALLERLSPGGDPRHPEAPVVLLESADTSTHEGERSILVTRAALRAECRGRRVTIEALGPQGRRALGWLTAQLEGAVREGDRISVEYPPPPRGASERERLGAPSPVDALRLLGTGWRLLSRPAPLTFLIAGTFAYDLLAAYEELPPARSDPIGWPDFEFFVPEGLVVVDHRRGTTRVIDLVFGGDGAERSLQDARMDLERTLAACREVAALGPPSSSPAPAAGPPPEVDVDDAGFAAAVDALKEHVRRGDVYQIVPSRTFRLACPDPLGAYRRLRRLNPSPYMFFLRGGTGLLFGASPETALQVSGAPRRVAIRPIAGTRPRGKDAAGAIDAELDGRLELDLRLDVKEQAEHVMLVDLARNDVARVSVPGTRAVTRLLTVERYSHVMHLVSEVEGRLRPGLDALDAYVATMNMGTLTGAPKLKAAELLRRHEETRRGPYGGAVGYLSADGELDTSIVIRSAVVKDGVAHVRAGAGVVFDSDPAAEADETRRKAGAVLRAIGGAD